MKKISLKKLLKLNNINIIDIRNKNEYLKFNIYNSKNIPFLDLFKNYDTLLNINEVYYIICETGYNSKKLCKYLNKHKYNVIHVKKGINKLYRFYF